MIGIRYKIFNLLMYKNFFFNEKYSKKLNLFIAIILQNLLLKDSAFLFKRSIEQEVFTFIVSKKLTK